VRFLDQWFLTQRRQGAKAQRACSLIPGVDVKREMTGSIVVVPEPGFVSRHADNSHGNMRTVVRDGSWRFWRLPLEASGHPSASICVIRRQIMGGWGLCAFALNAPDPFAPQLSELTGCFFP
jgi:hypothetical protein